MIRGCLVTALLGVIAFASAGQCAKTSRTWSYLTTGNGHGFQVYDLSQNKLTYFLEHPYRYLRPSADPSGDGVGRRNLLYDFYFGLRTSGGSGWLSEGTAGEPEYVEQTNIIRAPVNLAGISADTYYFAPFGYEGNAMLALLHAPAASDGFALFNFHMGAVVSGQPDTSGESLRRDTSETPFFVETGPGGGAMVYLPLTPLRYADCQDVYNKVKNGQPLVDHPECTGDNIVPAFQAELMDGWFAVAMIYVENSSAAATAAQSLRNFVGNRAPPELLQTALAEWRTWRKPPPATLALCSDDEKRLWQQSEAILRMGQVREPYTATRKNHGMMLASLPVGEWHTGWVRDAMYAIVALARMGHFDEAKMALEFFLNAGPVGKFKSFVKNTDYRISVVRYFGNGEEEADYSGQPTPNIELDGWGMFLWGVRQYIEASSDVAWLSSRLPSGVSVWDTILSGVAQPLSANLETSGVVQEDSSIWEVHQQNKKHYAYTTLAAIRGFCDLAATAKILGRNDTVTSYSNLSQKARSAFWNLFLDQNGAIAGSIEELGINQYLDAAVVEAFTWNILSDKEYAGRSSQASLDLLERLRIDSGGFKRNDDGLSSYDNNEWILIDLRMSDAFWRASRESSSQNLLQLVVDKAAANFYLLPELYNAVRADGAIGKYTGSIPMVGYGGGAYVLTLLDRSGLIEPNHCGDGAGNQSSGRPYVCARDGENGGKNDNSANSDPASFPYENACLCQMHAPSARVPFWTLISLTILLTLLHRRTLSGLGRRPR